MNNNRVVITGIGAISPNGSGIAEFLNSMKLGRSGIKYISELKDYNFFCQVGGIPDIKNKTSTKTFEEYQLTEADLSIKYAVLAGLEAWSNAGLGIPEYFSETPNNDAGAIIGSCFGGLEIFTRKIYPLVSSGHVKNIGSQTLEQWMMNGSVAALSRILALANQTTANSSACATGTEAIAMAYDRIKDGKAKIMLAGGTDPYSPYVWAGFDSMRLLSRRFNDCPEKASRPMSESANGFVPSAGAGVLVIEDLEHALERNAPIFAEIVGAAVNSGGQRNGGSMTAANPKRSAECINDAINQAGINGNQIDLICGHLTGTKADSSEVTIWKNALKLNNKFPYLNAPKSMIGHMIGAAGAVETIAAVLQLHEDCVHPSINCEDLHPEIEKIWDKNKIPQKNLHNAGLKYVAKAGFGFGDVNSCLILKKFE
ncbi:MAG: beta-ketoacyl-[acyl-carrier-protein] synthase family protein [Bacteroidales bacterium]|nr:beta-ketoacyl-[acyl-carrier-protein] synthase family protein [Bacteroidales bacterium]